MLQIKSRSRSFEDLKVVTSIVRAKNKTVKFTAAVVYICEAVYSAAAVYTCAATNTADDDDDEHPQVRSDGSHENYLILRSLSFLWIFLMIEHLMCMIAYV